MKYILNNSILLFLLMIYIQSELNAQNQANNEIRVEFGTGYLNGLNNENFENELDKLALHCDIFWQVNNHLFVGLELSALKLLEKNISFTDSSQNIQKINISHSAIPINFISKYIYNGYFIAFGFGVVPVFYELNSIENNVKFTENFVDVISKLGYEYRLSNSFLLSSNLFYMNILKLEQVKLSVQVNLIFSF